MKKLIKNNLISFIIGGIIFGSIGVGAATHLYNSDQVEYTPTDATWNVQNVRGAIDDLYSKSKTPVAKEFVCTLSTRSNSDEWSSQNTTYTFDVTGYSHVLVTSLSLEIASIYNSYIYIDGNRSYIYSGTDYDVSSASQVKIEFVPTTSTRTHTNAISLKFY